VLLVGNLPEGELVGGVEVGVEMLLASPLAARHGIHLFNTARRRDPSRPLRQRLAYQLGRFLQLARTILRERPRLVHVKGTVGVNYWQSIGYCGIARLLGPPVALQLHGGDFDVWYHEHNRLARLALRLGLRLPSELVVLSDYWRTFTSGLCPGKPIRIIPNGVRTEEVQPRVPRSDHELRVVTVGALGVRKGHFDILEAAARLGDRRVRFVFAGADEFGGEEQALRQRASELGIADRVDFAGIVTGRDKWRLLAEHDVFLLPSRGENMPNAVLEAMAAGVPVVANDSGGTRELIPGERYGWLLPEAATAGELALALREVIDRPEDSRSRAAAARERVRTEFTIEAMAERYLAILGAADTSAREKMEACSFASVPAAQPS